MDFRKLLQSDTGFVPKTQSQALQAFSEGVLGSSFFIHKAVNVHPIVEEPWDLDEMDRILAKPDLDYDTAASLVSVFNRMIRQPDKELALFAAESLDALERRYVSLIRALGSERQKNPTADTFRALAKTCIEVGHLFGGDSALGSFYLSEALRMYAGEPLLAADPLDSAARAILMMETGKPDEAATIINAALEMYSDHRGLRMAAAELAFRRRDISGVISHLEYLSLESVDQDASLSDEEIVAFWTGGACRD